VILTALPGRFNPRIHGKKPLGTAQTLQYAGMLQTEIHNAGSGPMLCTTKRSGPFPGPRLAGGSFVFSEIAFSSIRAQHGTLSFFPVGAKLAFNFLNISEASVSRTWTFLTCSVRPCFLVSMICRSFFRVGILKFRGPVVPSDLWINSRA